MMKRIPVAGPWITQREINYVTDAVSTAWYAEAGKYHERFEAAFAAHAGVPYAMSLPSCTSGLHLALSALGVGPGDEVIVPEVTWIATSAPISYVGATPVFADVDPVTWCVSPESVEAAITPRTKALITVDLYGNMADYERLVPLAAKHGLHLIEDAAEAAGATYHGQPAGSFGAVAVFSFHGSKTLTTGEGGMLLTRHKPLFDRASFLRDHGREPGDFSFQNSEVAFKYKMSSMQAALGLAQTERLDELITKKRQAFRWYQERLSGLDGVRLNNPGPHVESSYWMASIVWDERYGFDKKVLAQRLLKMGVDTRPFFSPLSSLPAYCSFKDKNWPSLNPVAYAISNRGINLPSSLMITEEDVDRVSKSVRAIFSA